MKSLRCTVISRLALATFTLLLVDIPLWAQSTDDGGAGRVDRYPYGGPPPAESTPPAYKVYEYQVYIPPAHKKGKKWPLLVYVHACGTSADRMRLASAMSPIADFRKVLGDVPRQWVELLARAGRRTHKRSPRRRR